MSLVTLPYRPDGDDPRSISSLLSNLDAILAQANGNLDTANLAASIVARLNPTGPGTNTVPVWNGTSWVAQKIKDAQIDAAAAIDYPKLAIDDGEIPLAKLDEDNALAGYHMRYSGTAWAASTIGVVRTAYKPAFTQKSNDATLAADPDLALAVVENEVVRIDGVLFGRADAANDFNFSLTAPSGTTGQWWIGGPATGAAAGETVGQEIRVECEQFGNAVTRGGLSAIGLQVAYPIRALAIVGGTSGSIRLWWAQRAAGATSSALMAGSYLSAVRVA